MSEEIKQAGGQNDQGSNQDDKPKYVPQKAYEDVSKDMHKYKSKLKDLEAEKNTLLSQIKAQEEQKMREQEQWKELYEQREAELESERKRSNEERNRYMKSVKMSALQSELGGKIKSDYLVHANIDAIQFNDAGGIDMDSLRSVANEFRNEHGQLIPKADNVKVTGHAPSNQPPQSDKSINDMTADELFHYYNKLKSSQ